MPIYCQRSAGIIPTSPYQHYRFIYSSLNYSRNQYTPTSPIIGFSSCSRRLHHRHRHPTIKTAAAAKKNASKTTTQSSPSISWLDDSNGDSSESSIHRLRPAEEATLRMLEWPRLCQHIAQFAQTTVGQKACSTIRPLSTQLACERALLETRAAEVMETEFGAELDFGGVQSAQAESALNRAAKGGMLSGSGLQAVASLLLGAARLSRAVKAVGREAEGSMAVAVMEPIFTAFKNVAMLPNLAAEIGFALDDAGNVREGASDGVKKASAKVRTITNRLRGVLKGGIGEITVHSGRMCVAVPITGDGSPPKGILLGTSAGGGTWYIEPPAAVPLNNELGAARGELSSAEEAVLWSLTLKVNESSYELLNTLRTLTWLDVTAAKARYGRWIHGTFPHFSSFPKTGKARGGSKSKAKNNNNNAVANCSSASVVVSENSTNDDQLDVYPSIEEDFLDSTTTEESKTVVVTEGLFISLRRLRHPLLLGDYLLNKQNEEKEKRKVENSSGRRIATGISRKKNKKKKAAAVDQSGLSASAQTDTDEDEEDSDYESMYYSGSESDSEESRKYKGPVPVDIVVHPTTRAVVITGPNTGGKTAGIKALGLAVCLARSGVPLPCADPALLPCFDAVLADIGDEQSLSASLSTFSGHLNRIDALRRESTGKSLVLLDELGTGTDPVEGAALGIALLEKMVKGGPGGAGLVFATTHHGALTALKYNAPFDTSSSPGGSSSSTSSIVEVDEQAKLQKQSGGKDDGSSGSSLQGKFENASVEFDDVALAPTYKLLWGIPGRSNALNIAQRLGLDQDVVEDARMRLGLAAAQVNSTIVELEELKRRADQDGLAAEKGEREVERLRNQMRIKRRELVERQAAQQASEARADIDAIRNARAELLLIYQQREKQLAEAEKQRLAEENKKQDSAALKLQKATAWLPKVGEFVFLPRLSKTAKVVSVDAASGQVSLQIGMMKVNAGVDEIRQRQ